MSEPKTPEDGLTTDVTAYASYVLLISLGSDTLALMREDLAEVITLHRDKMPAAQTVLLQTWLACVDAELNIRRTNGPTSGITQTNVVAPSLTPTPSTTPAQPTKTEEEVKVAEAHNKIKDELLKGKEDLFWGARGNEKTKN